MSVYLLICEGLTLEKKWKYGIAVVCGHSRALLSPVKQLAYQVGL